MESRIEMSQRERDILKIITALLQGKRTQSEAARLLRVSAGPLMSLRSS
jgi:hypothetical protein